MPLRKNLDVREDVWFYDAPIGVHSLQMIVSILCKKAGFSGFYTNQLRASDATRLYEAGVEEQLLMETTGHRSEAVRAYKPTGDRQKMEVSSILQGSKQISM